MTKNEFKRFANSMGIECRYSGKAKTMFLIGNNSQLLKMQTKNEVNFNLVH